MPPKKQQKLRKKKESEDILMLDDSPYCLVQLKVGGLLMPQPTVALLASMSSQAPPSRLGDENYTKMLGLQPKTLSRLMSNFCRFMIE
jgi:hypothetical protein